MHHPRAWLNGYSDPSLRCSLFFDTIEHKTAARLKPFHQFPVIVQVLNLMLYKLTKCPYDDALLAFLSVDEHLVDIGDDLVDYEVRLSVFGCTLRQSCVLYGIVCGLLPTG